MIYSNIVKMSISLILIGIISTIVIIGIIFLLLNKNGQFPEHKKSTILLVIGIVIFISFIVTTIKYRRTQFIHKNIDQNDIDVNKVFFADGCDFTFEHKYSNIHGIQQQQLLQFYYRNYKPVHVFLQPNQEGKSQKKIDFQEVILYHSKKDEGASYFLTHLSKEICLKRKLPVLYLKLTEQIIHEKYFMIKAGLHKFQTLKNTFCHFSGIQIIQKIRKNRIQVQYNYKSMKASSERPYLIIDNIQHLLDTLAESSERSSKKYKRSYVEQEYEQSHKQQSQQQMQQQEEQIKQQENDDNQYYSEFQNQIQQKTLFLSKILNELINKCKINVIFNSEDHQALHKIYLMWEQSHQNQNINTFQKNYQNHQRPYQHRKNHNQNKNKFIFEVHKWQGPTQYDLYKIISRQYQNKQSIYNKFLQYNNKEQSYNSKEQSYNFKTISNVISQIDERIARDSSTNYKNSKMNDEEGIGLKDVQMKNHVALYFGVEKAYGIIKAASERDISVLKHRVNWEDMNKLEELKLIEIQGGRIVLI